MSDIEKFNGKEFSKEKLAIIKQICIPSGASDAHVAVLLDFAARYGLDPLLKELQLVPFGGKFSVMTGQDGYMKIASRHADFGGVRAGIIYEGQPYDIDWEKGIVKTEREHEFRTKGIWGAWSVVFRKGRVPTIEIVEMKEYRKNSPVWKTYPGEMLKKVARVRALKFSFEITGLVTSEEMGDPAQGPERAVNVTPPVSTIPAKKPKPIVKTKVKVAEVIQIDKESSSFPNEVFLDMGRAAFKKLGGEKFRLLTAEVLGKEVMDIRSLPQADKEKLFCALENV